MLDESTDIVWSQQLPLRVLRLAEDRIYHAGTANILAELVVFVWFRG